MNESSEGEVLMDAVIAVLSRRDEIMDPEGLLDLEKLMQVKELVLPLERRLAAVVERQDEIARRQDQLREQQRRILNVLRELNDQVARLGGCRIVDSVGPEDLGKPLPRLRLVDPADASE